MQQFPISALNVLAHAGGFTLWHYPIQPHILAYIKPGFFDFAAEFVSQGDMIAVSASDGVCVLGVVSVSGNPGEVVTKTMAST